MKELIVGLLLLVAPGLRAQSDRWERQVASALIRTDVAMAVEGFRPVGQTAFTVLPEEHGGTVPLPTAPPGSVVVVAACDLDCGGVGLVVGSGTGYDLDADRSGGTVPMARFTLRVPTALTARVTMERCQVGPCRLGVRVYHRRP